MTIHLYQIIVAVISVIMIYQGTIRYIRKESGQTILKVFVRLSVWGGMIAITIFPNLTNLIANFVGLQGNINAVILTGFLLIFLMIFKLLSAIERLEQNITEVTRKEAISVLKERR